MNNMLLSSALSSKAIDETGALRRELLLVNPVDGSDLLYELLSSITEDSRYGTGVVSITGGTGVVGSTTTGSGGGAATTGGSSTAPGGGTTGGTGGTGVGSTTGGTGVGAGPTGTGSGSSSATGGGP